MSIEVESWALYREQLQKAKPKQQQIIIATYKGRDSTKKSQKVILRQKKSNGDENKQKEVKSYKPRGFTGSN